MNNIEMLINELLEEGYPCKVIIEDSVLEEEIPSSKYCANIVDMETGGILLDRNGDYPLIAYGKTIIEAMEKLDKKVNGVDYSE